jgi:amino acid transporter
MKRLARSLNLGDLLVLSSTSMAPAYSIAAVMGLVVATSGTGAPFALLVSTIPIAFIAVGFMRLTSKLPSAGAVYTW